MRVAGVAATIATVVVVSGFAIQWAALPDAGRGNAISARAALWLTRYRYVDGTLRLGGRTLHTTCFHGWIEGRHGRPTRGTLLRLGTGEVVRDLPPHTILFSGPRLRRPVAALESAGCTKVLGDRLAGLAEFGRHVRARRATLGDGPALAIDWPRVTLYVEPGTDVPIGVNAFGIHGRFRLVALHHRVRGET